MLKFGRPVDGLYRAEGVDPLPWVSPGCTLVNPFGLTVDIFESLSSDNPIGLFPLDGVSLVKAFWLAAFYFFKTNLFGVKFLFGGVIGGSAVGFVIVGV